MRYDVILADPPWTFQTWDRETGIAKSAERHYRTMSLDDICALPVGDVAADDCALFIWAVWPSIFDAEKVIEAWGFRYRTLAFEWWKLNRGWSSLMEKLSGTGYRELERLFFMGLGYYTRANSEPCLLAVRGRMPVATHAERNCIIAPVRAHSQKPDEQYEKIERLYPGRRYLELFARERRPNWDALGDAVDGMDIHTTIARLR